MDFFTKAQYMLLEQLEHEISYHSHSIFDTYINSIQKEFTDRSPDSKSLCDILLFLMEDRFSCLIHKAFRFGINHSDSSLKEAVQEYLALPPDEVSAERIQKTVSILAEEIDNSDLFSQFLTLLQQAYSLEPYLEQIIQTGIDAQNQTSVTVKKAGRQMKPPFSLRQLECLILAAQGKSKSQIAKILRISYGQVAGALDYGSIKIRMTVKDIPEYNAQEIIKSLAQRCSMTERSMGKCIEHIVNTAMDLTELRAYIQPLTVDEVLHKLYEYCKK